MPIKITKLETGISLLDVSPSIPGIEGLLGVYVIQSERTALVDTGPAASLENLFTGLSELKINPEQINYVLCTHIHLDHTGGLGAAIKRMPDAKVIVHEKGRRHLISPARLWEGSLQVLGQMARDYGQPEPVSEEKIVTAQEGMVIDLGRIQIETLLTPGHAPHHLSFLDRKQGILFSGEAAGVYFTNPEIFRPASPPPFDLRQALASADKLIAAHPKEIYYAHIGHASNAVSRIENYKAQLIGWSKIIAKHLDNSDVSKITDEVLTWDKTREIVSRLPSNRLQIELFFIKNNILGILDYLKREGTSILDEIQA